MSKSTKICILSSAHADGDVRIFHKECVSLAQAGFETYMIIPNAESRQEKGVSIIGVNGKYNSRFKRMTKTVMATYRNALSTGAKIYHFQDPELMPIGVLLKLRGNKVIYDVHEDVPVQILDKKWLGPYFMRLMVSLSFRMFQWFCCLFFDHVFTATPEISKRFSANKTTTLHNYPIITYLQQAKAVDYTKTKPAVIYAGGLTRLRGIKELIEAVGRLDGKAELWLMGVWESDEFEQECASLPAFQHTKFFGKMPLEQVYTYYKIADIGAHTVYPSDRHLIGIPTKILECMAIAMPVVLTDGSYWRDFFKDTAKFVDALDPQDIATTLEQLIDNKESTQQMAQEGKKLVTENYTWEIEKEKLVDVYQKLIKT